MLMEAPANISSIVEASREQHGSYELSAALDHGGSIEVHWKHAPSNCIHDRDIIIPLINCIHFECLRALQSI
jgi:hypothetical protein